MHKKGSRQQPQAPSTIIVHTSGIGLDTPVENLGPGSYIHICPCPSSSTRPRAHFVRVSATYASRSRKLCCFLGLAQAAGMGICFHIATSILVRTCWFFLYDTRCKNQCCVNVRTQMTPKSRADADARFRNAESEVRHESGFAKRNQSLLRVSKNKKIEAGEQAPPRMVQNQRASGLKLSREARKSHRARSSGIKTSRS